MKRRSVIDVDSLHARVCVADGHADSLMWRRDLNTRSTHGHVDFPRLKDAGVKLQCFTVVTQGYPLVDGFGAFAAQRGWPREARATRWARCVAQLDWMHALAGASQGTVAVAPTGAALEDNLRRGALSAVLGVEGLQALEGDASRVAELARRGVRFASPLHLANNALGGSSFPLMGNRGLTPHGREVVEAMVAHGLAIDVAHASRRTLDDLLAVPGARPFCSHGGVDGAHRSWRNLPDHALKAIADAGGVVGIILTPIYLGGTSLEAVVRHVEHALSVMGEDGVGLGSDFDGMVPLPQGMRDVRDLRKVTAALLKRLPTGTVEKILGENLRRFFREL